LNDGDGAGVGFAGACSAADAAAARFAPSSRAALRSARGRMHGLMPRWIVFGR
jgi:hypothetical protein